MSIKKAPSSPPPAIILTDWYRLNHRRLPWRATPGQGNDPYHVWLSEIMLQQTTVVTVVPYYEKFLAKWPRITDLAQAPIEDVLRDWAGLGYYARARNLHACAQTVVNDYGGQFPRTVADLLKLPGVGPYTAAAIGAIAFGIHTVPVDGNVERVMSRLYMIDQPLPAAKPDIKHKAQALLDQAPEVFPGDFAQALMDLGATVCTPRNPKCPLCPLAAHCLALKAGKAADYPIPTLKKAKPQRYGVLYLIKNAQGEYLVIRRPGQGLLGGMLAFPTSEWQEISTERAAHAPKNEKSAPIIGQIRHSFTHFDLILDVVAPAQDHLPLDLSNSHWLEPARLPAAGLPKVFLKALPFTMVKHT